MTARRCEARIGYSPDEYGWAPLTCGQRVGISPIIDASGFVRGACSRDGHMHDVIRRFGRYAGELAADEIAALDDHAEGTFAGSRGCGAGGSTPHWVHCPEHGAPGELMEAWGK